MVLEQYRLAIAREISFLRTEIGWCVCIDVIRTFFWSVHLTEFSNTYRKGRQ